MARPSEYGTAQIISEIYAGVWGALPDKEGLEYWVNEVDNNGWTFEQVVSSFAEQQRVIDRYSDEDGNPLEGDDLLAALYQNIFRIDEPDAEGFAYWQGVIADNPELDLLGDGIGNLVMQMIDGMWANPAAAETQALYNNFVTATALFVAAQEGGTAFSELTAEEQEAFLLVATNLTASVTAESTAEELEALVGEADWPGEPEQIDTFTLAEALALEELPELYNIDPAEALDAGPVSVEDAEAAFAAVSAVLAGAANAESLDLAEIFIWALEDSLENLVAAEAAVVAGAASWTLTDPAGDLGTLSADQVAVVMGASNSADYTFTGPVASFSLAPAATSMTEGESLVFTVTALDANGNATAVEAATSFFWTIEGVAQGVASAASAADFESSSGSVSIAAGETTGTISITAVNDGIVEGFEAFRVILADATTLEPVVTSANVLIQDGPGTFTLTAGLDNFVGTTGNDTFNANFATALGALDSIDGGAGIDTLNIFGIDADGGAAPINIPTTATVKNIEIANVTGAAAVTVDASGWTGLTELNLKQSAGAATITAAATTDVSTAGTGDTLGINGGLNVTVSDTTNNKNIDIGATTGPAGTITVTDTKQGTGTIKIDGGTDVTVTASSQTTGKTGVITIGNATVPTGVVTVTSNLSNAAAAATPMAGDVITVNGGTTVNVTQTATQAVMATASTNSTTTQSKVVVNGGAATTSVTVNQTAAVAAQDTKLAVAAVTEIQTVTFADTLANNVSVTVNGLTFTNTSGATITAAQVAAAFANLANGTTQGNSTLGTYQGVFTAGFTSAGVSGTGNNQVAFTATTAGDKVNIGVTGAGVSVAETVKGVTAVAAAGKGGIANGVVEIADAGYNDAAKADTITTVTVDGYADDSFVKSDALTSLSLANSAGTFAAYNNTATTLDLAVNNVTHAVNIDTGAAKYATLNVTTSGDKSAFALTAEAVKTLTVGGDKALDLTGSTLTALQTVTVSGAAGLTVDASGATVTAVNTAASTGTNVIKIDGSKATYTGGAGVDNVTLTSNTVSKAIALGEGNDKVTLADGTTAVTGSINGGGGTDTLVMRAQDAATASGTEAFATKVTGFEILSLTGGGTHAIDLDVLGKYTQVESNAATAITLNKMASGGSFTITGESIAHVVNVTDAADGKADVLNLGLKSAGDLKAGTVTVADVETINITSTDTDTTAHTNTLTLTADKATTVNVSGNAGLDLMLAGSTKITNLDASEMTAGLTVTSTSTQAVTITGGSGDDVLKAATGTVAHTLIGGDGNDTLISNKGLSVLTGGEGRDVFVVQEAGANVNIYTTITDFSAGDRLVLLDQGAETFNTEKLTLGATAVFQDYANLAASNTGPSFEGPLTNAVISWFQFGGDTYVVMDRSASDTFVNGTDIIVKLTGLIDLSTASLNNANSAIEASGAVLML